MDMLIINIKVGIVLHQTASPLAGLLIISMSGCCWLHLPSHHFFQHFSLALNVYNIAVMVLPMLVHVGPCWSMLVGALSSLLAPNS